MATRYYDDSPAPRVDESGIPLIRKAIAAAADNAAVQANPVGPPSLVRAPALNNAVAEGVRINPAATRLQNEGALRPVAGAFSAANPQPMLDAGGALVRPLPTPPQPIAALPANPAARAATAISTAAPVLATVTPATAANAPALARAAPPLGRMENGVRVFSDGTGQGAPAASITRPQIDALAQRNVVQSVVPAPGVAASMATGGTTPELGSLPTLKRQVADPAAAANAALAAAQMNRDSDLRSIATGDTRSAVGALARKFGDAGDAVGLHNLVASTEGGVDATGKLAGQSLQEEGANARSALQQSGENARTDVNARTDLARAALTRQQQTVTQADGTLSAFDPVSGQLKPVTNPDGTPVRPQESRKDIDQGAYAKLVESNTARLLGVDPISGMIPGVDGGKPRAPTAQELEAATAAASQIADRAFGRAAAGGAATAKPSKTEFLAKARTANPGVPDAQLEKFYAEKYGS